MNIQRALFEVRGIWSENKAMLSDPQIVRVLYFRALDLADSQLRDPAALALVRGSGLESEISTRALLQASHATPYRGDQGKAYKSETLYAIVIFYANPRLPVFCSHLSELPVGDTQLDDAAATGDTAAVRRETARRLYPALLAHALSSALRYPFDNSQVIQILIRAGANPNGDSTLPTGAVVRPLADAVRSGNLCGLETLIALGANPNLIDASGKTALDLARSERLPNFVRVLESASGSGKSSR